MKTPLSDLSQAEQELLARARRSEQHAALANLPTPVLQEISRSQGIDFATALLYDRLRRSAQHGSFIRQVEAELENPPEHAAPRVTVVPGAFYREHPHTGADGKRLFEIAGQLRWPVDRIEIESFGALDTSARMINDWLLARRAKPRILVSLSKGGADLKIALARPETERAMSDAVSWINLSGLVTGTPLIAWLRARRLRSLGVRILLWLRGQCFAVLDELRHGAGSPLHNWPTIPGSLRVIHVVGFPLRRHLSNSWARRGYERLAPLGPNDGGVFFWGMLRDGLSWEDESMESSGAHGGCDASCGAATSHPAARGFADFAPPESRAARLNNDAHTASPTT